MQQIDSVLRRSALTSVVFLIVVIGLSGCMMPFPNHQVLEGSEIAEESLIWVHLSETSRTQVLEKLGAPDIDFVDQHVIAYAWSGVAYEIVMVIGFHGSTQPIRMRRALLVRFDSVDKVAAFSIINRSTNVIPYDALDQSRDAHLDNWGVILDQWLAEHQKK